LAQLCCNDWIALNCQNGPVFLNGLLGLVFASAVRLAIHASAAGTGGRCRRLRLLLALAARLLRARRAALIEPIEAGRAD